MISVGKEAKKYIITSLNNKLFSGAAVGFSKYDNSGDFKRCLTYDGFTENIEKQYPVKRDIFFDLASLTKPLTTVLCILNLISEGKIHWQERLSSLLSQRVNQNKTDITLYQLLTHSSGFPAYRPYYKKLKQYHYNKAKKKIIDCILDEKLEYLPGRKTIYSDLGYILLGHIIESKTGEKIDEFWERTIAKSFHLKKKILYLKNSVLGPDKCVATSIGSSASQPVTGIVNDDNCRVMGGIAGHAGLFGTLEGVLSICEKLFKQYENICVYDTYANSVLREALSRRSESSWVCGFDTPSIYNSVAGQYFSRKSFGHLGYTGTSFWIDMKKGIIVVVLTNRVYMKTSKERMNQFRRVIHNKIMKGISDLKE